MSAKAGLVTNIPTVTPKIVVSAKPLNNPAPAQNNGNIAAIIVKNAPIIMKKALFIFSPIPIFAVETASSIITIWSLTPVPIPAIIPAIDGASKFHFISEAIPKVINASENIVKITDNVIFIFLYLTKIRIETIMKAIAAK